MALTLQCDDKYDPDKMIKMPPIPFNKRMMIRIMALFMLPVVMIEGLTKKVIVNPLHDGKRELTGVKKFVMSELFKLDEIKTTSK